MASDPVRIPETAQADSSGSRPKPGMTNGGIGIPTGIPVSMRAAAKYYIEHGLSVVPLCANNKYVDLPVLSPDSDCRSKGSYRNLTTDPATPAQLDRWFDTGSRNIGILAGYRNLLILDFDCQEAYWQWRRLHPELSETTPTQETRNGYHVFLRLDPRGPYGLLWRVNYIFSNFSIDPVSPDASVGQIMWHGCQVAAYPSVIDGESRYSWMPGQAPQHGPPATIRSLPAAGIYTGAILRRRLAQFLGNWIRDPVRNLAHLYVIALRFSGRKDIRFRPTYQALRSKLGLRRTDQE